MDNKREELLLDLNVVIVQNGVGNKVIAFAESLGMRGATVLLGKGTFKNSWLKFLELNESSKEIVLFLCTRERGESFLIKASEHFKFEKPNHGIAISLPVIQTLGFHPSGKLESLGEIKESGGKTMYNTVIAVVDKGRAEKVIDAATEAGARGATIVNARGSGLHETSKIFAIEIEPEKELVLMVVEEAITEAVCENINNRLEIEKPGKGVLFVHRVNKAYGLY